MIENVVFFPMHADVHLSKKAGFPKQIGYQFLLNDEITTPF